jgi:hypothetical protein
MRGHDEASERAVDSDEPFAKGAFSIRQRSTMSKGACRKEKGRDRRGHAPFIPKISLGLGLGLLSAPTDRHRKPGETRAEQS